MNSEYNSTPPETTRQLNQIAYAAASLSDIVPVLADVSQEMEIHARKQAESARIVADLTQNLTHEMDEAIKELHHNSDRTTQIIDTISGIAGATKILAINASIQAARVGDAGKGFLAVADNIKKLATDTSSATGDVEKNITTIRDNVDRVSKVVRKHENETQHKEAKSEAAITGIHEIHDQISEIASSAEQQQSNVLNLRELGGHTRTLAEDLILNFGKFRLDFHQQAAAIIENLALEDAYKSSDRAMIEDQMHVVTMQYPYIQLVYQTNAQGTQITSNIGPAVTHEEGVKAFGSDWSDRPWYSSVARTQELQISDIYRSVSTDKFCFTVSAPILDTQGELAGVLGADFDMVKLLDHIQ